MKSIMEVLKTKYLIGILLLVSLLAYGIIAITLLSTSTAFPADLIYFENDLYSEGQDGSSNAINYGTYEDLEEEFGVTNVSRSTVLKNDGRFSYYAVDSDFLNTGVVSYNKDLERDILQNVELIAGGVWGVNSQDKSVIIDQRVADYYNIGEDDLGYMINISGHYFGVAAIVTNTTLVASDQGEITNGNFLSGSYDDHGNIYLPYYYSGFNFDNEDYSYEDPEAIIVKTDGYLSLKDSRAKILEIVYQNQESEKDFNFIAYAFDEVVAEEILETEIFAVISVYYIGAVLIFYTIKKTFFE